MDVQMTPLGIVCWMVVAFAVGFFVVWSWR